LKPHNILLDEDGEPRVTDFGLAKVLGADIANYDHGRRLGTPGYMSPEQARGAPGDARSDLFAVGVVLYEALTGTKAFPGDDLATVLDEVLHVDPVPARERNFAVSPALDAVVHRALDKNPEDRYPDAAAFAEAVMQAAAIGESDGDSRWVTHGRRATLVAGAIVLSLVAGFVASPLFGPRGAEDRTVAVGSETKGLVPPPEAPPAPVTPVVPAAPGTRTAPAAPAAPAATVSAGPAVDAQAASTKRGCVSVNAVPFAKVYVDGRPVGETPQACVRVREGQHRIQFQWGGERSPEHVITVAQEHTRDNPLRASYDFKEGRFVAGSE
jgi:hypothetical protein